MSIWISLVVAILLVGCASVPPPVVLTPAKEVLVPVLRTCDVELPKAPKWEIDQAEPDDLFARMDVALTEVEQRIVYLAELEAAIRYCIEPSDSGRMNSSE